MLETGIVQGRPYYSVRVEVSILDLNCDGTINPAATVLDGHLGRPDPDRDGGPRFLIGGPKDTLLRAERRCVCVPEEIRAETVKNFTPGTDQLLFSQSMFANVAAVLSDAHQVGSNVVIAHDPQNVVTLQNTQLNTLHASDIHII